MCWCLTYCFSSKYNGHFMHINCPVLYVSGRRTLSSQTVTHPMVNSVILDMTLSFTTNRDIFFLYFQISSASLPTSTSLPLWPPRPRPMTTFPLSPYVPIPASLSSPHVYNSLDFHLVCVTPELSETWSQT